jgi:hypothetical protein
LLRAAVQAHRPIDAQLLGYIGRPHYALSPFGSEVALLPT